MTPAALALVMTATATEPIPPDLFRDYSACTRGRQVCAAERDELRDKVRDLEEELAEKPPASGGVDPWTVVLITGSVAVVVGAVAFAVGVAVGASP